MRIVYDDKEHDFIEVYRDPTTSKIIISLSAQDPSNSRKTVVNSVDMTEVEFLQLISDLNLVI